MIEITEALERLLRSRLCASTPAQYGYLAGLKGDNIWMEDYLNMIKKHNNLCLNHINKIDGISVQPPRGAFYMFVRITHEYWRDNDKEFVLKLLNDKHVLLVHGSGFSAQYGKGQFRMVFLPSEKILTNALTRIDEFLQQPIN